jgi:phage shock protein C
MAEGRKKLYRSSDDRWLAGVCGGIAAYFDLDPTLIRVLFVLFGFAVGGGLIIYLILWLVIPQSPTDDALKIGEQE